MEQPKPDAASEDAMDSFLEKFQSQPYHGRFREERWEEEFEKIPLFMKKAPSKIDPKENPDLACLQSIIFDDERPPEEQAKTYKDEGNEYFKEKDYEKAVISYTEGLKKKCADPDLNVVLYTNRAAAQYYLGNFRSALNDVTAARKLKPCHLKAIVRGALCHLELKNFAEAVNWCDEGLQIDAKEKKLLEMRIKADRLKRTEQRDIRKAKLKEKKEQNQNEALLQAIKARNIRLVSEAASEDEDSASEGLSTLLDGLSFENPYGTRLSIDDQGRLSWPVLFLYPEYAQSDFISAFHEDSRAELYRVPPKSTLLQVLQHPRYFVKTLTPAFLVCVESSPFCRNYLRGERCTRRSSAAIVYREHARPLNYVVRLRRIRDSYYDSPSLTRSSSLLRGAYSESP
ncbi:hypothetical protein QTO34_015932 [Cnephaeus nilssonii]|uniref:Cns1/TTC4 wheel domain-containing protein n=1 Tax=Cnephaeus nilssonii TaxID=3371016 RepID=A0AA40LTD3_CNENI|nr:hypothetical protein QTO34_015932 [Eptesicus nilssonii]